MKKICVSLTLYRSFLFYLIFTFCILPRFLWTKKSLAKWALILTTKTAGTRPQRSRQTVRRSAGALTIIHKEFRPPASLALCASCTSNHLLLLRTLFEVVVSLFRWEYRVQSLFTINPVSLYMCARIMPWIS